MLISIGKNAEKYNDYGKEKEHHKHGNATQKESVIINTAFAILIIIFLFIVYSAFNR